MCDGELCPDPDNCLPKIEGKTLIVPESDSLLDSDGWRELRTFYDEGAEIKEPSTTYKINMVFRRLWGYLIGIPKP